MKYNVSIEKEGRLYKVGTLEGTDHNDTVFTYDGAYLNDTSTAALSVMVTGTNVCEY